MKNITVNGKRILWQWEPASYGPFMSFEGLRILAQMPPGTYFAKYYWKGEGDQIRSGTISPDDPEIYVREGMIFNIMDTGNA